MKENIIQTLTKSMFCLVLACFSIAMKGENLRYLSSQYGISNSSVLSLAQIGNKGIFVWTCEGLDIWNGGRFAQYPEDGMDEQSLSGNLVEEMYSVSDSVYWIRTNYGLDLFRGNKVQERHPEFQGMYKVLGNSSGTFVLTQDNDFYSYSPDRHSFTRIDRPAWLSYDHTLATFIYQKRIYLVTSTGILSCSIIKDKDGISLKEDSSYLTDKHFSFARRNDTGCFIVDEDNILYSYNCIKDVLVYEFDCHELLKSKGPISDIIRDGNDIVMSFMLDGVFFLRSGPQSEQRYRLEETSIKCGVFDLMKDRYQDIIWVGTDGLGLAMIYKDDIQFRSYGFDILHEKISTPVRVLYMDREGDLWIGTKGNGIIKVRDFNRQTEINDSNSTIFNPSNSRLTNATVFAISGSARDLIWIGSDGKGLNYYSYKDHSIHDISYTFPDEFRYIHGIYEKNRDTLWVATVGNGIYRLTLEENASEPKIKSLQKIALGNYTLDHGFFFCMYPDKDGSIYFGNRGEGMVWINPQGHIQEVMKFDKGRNQLANDIWCILKTADDRLWVGTSYGPICVSDNLHDSGFHRLVHGMLSDDAGNLWMSTNSGIVKFSPEESRTIIYDYTYGLRTVEFSDGATMSDGSRMFFGGTNGFVTIQKEDYSKPDFVPQLHFLSAVIERDGGKSLVDLSDYSSRVRLKIRSSERLSEVSVAATDYIDGRNIIYYFKIDGPGSHWTSTTSDILLPKLRYGKYTLRVKYFNAVNGYTSAPETLHLRILPRWYQTLVMKLLYLLVVLYMLGMFVRRKIRQQKARIKEAEDQLQIEKEKELHNMQSSIFGNIVQDLSISVTMIDTPCQMMKDYPDSDKFIKERCGIIEKQTSNLRSMLKDFHDFQDADLTSKKISNKLFSVNEIIDNLVRLLIPMSKSSGVSSRNDISSLIAWNSDSVLVSSILESISEVIINHSIDGERVSFDASKTEDRLNISINSSSASSDTETLARILKSQTSFNDVIYRIRTTYSMQELIKLVLCSRDIVRLNGSFDVIRKGDGFSVICSLPSMKGTDDTVANAESFSSDIHSGFNAGHHSMIIMGSDPDITNILKDLFSAEYDVTICGAANIRDTMKTNIPDIILVENVNMRPDFLEICRSLHSDKLTLHIPIVLLTTMRQVDLHANDIEASSDMYLSLPFNVETLKARIKNIIDRGNALQDYYHTSVSAYTITGGKLLHNEDRTFLNSISAIIGKNISNNSMSPKMIAEELGVSLRSMYYRLSKITDESINDIIRNYRMEYAKRLLVSTKMTIDEVIYACGYSNRGTFFKNFSAKFGMTPRKLRADALKDLDTADSKE